MKKRLATMALVTSLVLCLPLFALAQVAPGAVPLVALTPYSVTLASIAFAVAFLVNAWNSGKIFGLVTTPVAALPYIGVAIPFLLAVYKALSEAGGLTLLSFVNAVQAGAFALLGSAGGAKTHEALGDHVSLARRTLASRGKTVALVLGLGLFGASQQACTPAQVATVPPVTQAAAPCVANVIADALEGMLVAQILIKEGPGCVSDAEQVMAILLGAAQSNPMVVKTKAYGESYAKFVAGKLPATSLTITPPAP